MSDWSGYHGWPTSPRVVAAVDRVLGTDGLATYERLAGRLAAEVVEGDPVAEAVRAFTTTERTWQGTNADLLDKLTANLPGGRPPRDWPTTPRAMGGALKRAAPALRAVGIGVETGRREAGTGRRLITLVLAAEEPSQPPPPSSQPSPEPADQPLRRDGHRDDHPNPTPNRHPYCHHRPPLLTRPFALPVTMVTVGMTSSVLSLVRASPPASTGRTR